MNKINFLSLEYVFIFDHYDTPLFFISFNKDDSKYYLFYLIDENVYFYSSLSKSDIDYLFRNPTGYDILVYLNNKSKLQLLLIKEELYISKAVTEYKNIFNEDLTEAFPTDRFQIEYDYFNKASFYEIKNNYRKYFDNMYNTEQLTLRIKDQQNSDKLDINIVSDAINYVINVWGDLRERLGEVESTKKLMMSAPSRGSLKLDFELDSENQTTIFDDDTSFSELIDFINNLEYLNNDSEKIISERKIIEETIKLYKVIEENELSIDFISKNIKLGNIKKSEKVKENLDKMQKIIREEFCNNNIINENINITGEVLAANKSRNYFKIRTSNLGDIAGVFERDLFNKIKKSEEQVTISKIITADVTKQTTINLDTQEQSIKYILNSFTQ